MTTTSQSQTVLASQTPKKIPPRPQLALEYKLFLSITFLIKLLLVPTLIALVTLAGRKWGPAVAGWLSAFPIIAGPILFFIALDQGSEFAVTAATGTLSAVFAVIVFSVAYAWAAMKFNWIGSLITALFCYALTVMGLASISLPLYAGFILNMVAVALVPRLFPVVTPRSATLKSGAYDLPICMVLSAGLVLLITYFAQFLGPRLAGVLVMFPIMTGSLCVFSHRSVGIEFTIHFLKGTTLGWRSFIMFCATLAVLLQKTSIGWAFSLAILVAVVVQILSRRYLMQARQVAEI